MEEKDVMSVEKLVTLGGNVKKQRNHEGNARSRAFVIGIWDAIQDPSVVTGTFLVNNLYAAILIESGADRSCTTTLFWKCLNHESSKLQDAYKV